MILGDALPDFLYQEKRSRRRGMDESSPDSESSKAVRVLFVQLATIAAFLVLLAALIRIQIFEGSYFRDLANGNRLRKITIHAPRGIIYDRNDTPLVINLPAFRLVSCDNSEKNCRASTISKDQAITAEAGGLSPNQSLEVDSVRSYPAGAATAHLLGYVSEITADELSKNRSYSLGDRIGRGGIEEAYESRLRGRDGKELIEVDALGKKIRTVGTIPAVPGENLRLVIDLDLQKIGYEQIQNKKAAIVVSDPAIGSILALISSPSFDPNVFTDLNLSDRDRDSALAKIFNDQSQPLFNRVIGGTYPPGSTFKIITATAGLESGKITENTVVDDPGILVIGPYKFPNWLFLRNGGTQGILNVVSAIQKSNDVFFYRVGEWVGVDGLVSWALKFGLGERLGVDLPGESSGYVPTASWREKYARDWYLGDTYHLAIGQGDLLVTPLQDNVWTAVIANGGKLCRPHVASLTDTNDLCKPIGISKKTIDLIQKGMTEACSPGGTAWPLFNFQIKTDQGAIRKIQIACKTGTAEFGDPGNRTHAWLTSFAPADPPAGGPKIAVTVLIEGGGEGSDVAAPVVSKVLEAWFSR